MKADSLAAVLSRPRGKFLRDRAGDLPDRSFHSRLHGQYISAFISQKKNGLCSRGEASCEFSRRSVSIMERYVPIASIQRRLSGLGILPKYSNTSRYRCQSAIDSDISRR